MRRVSSRAGVPPAATTRCTMPSGPTLQMAAPAHGPGGCPAGCQEGRGCERAHVPSQHPLERFDVAAAGVEVLEVRPCDATGELHGLYAREPGRRPHIQVWMRLVPRPTPSSPSRPRAVRV